MKLFFKFFILLVILSFSACQNTTSDSETPENQNDETASNDVYIQSNFTQIDENQIEYEDEIYFSSESIASLDIESNESNLSKTYFGNDKNKYWIPESKVKEHTSREFLTLYETVNDNDFTENENKLFYFKVLNSDLDSEPTSAKITLLTKVKYSASNPMRTMYVSTTEDKNQDIQIFYNSALENHTFFLTVELNEVTMIYKLKFNKDSVAENITVLNIDIEINNIFDFSQNEPTDNTDEEISKTQNTSQIEASEPILTNPNNGEETTELVDSSILEDEKSKLTAKNIEFEVFNFTQNEIEPIYETEIRETFLEDREYIFYEENYYLIVDERTQIVEPRRYSEKMFLFGVTENNTLDFRFKARKVIYEPEIERIKYLIETKNQTEYIPVPEEKIESFLDVIYPNLDVKNDRKVISTDKTKFYYPDDENEQALI